MTGESYVQYILSETNVEAAVVSGTSERSGLGDVLADFSLSF